MGYFLGALNKSVILVDLDKFLNFGLLFATRIRVAEMKRIRIPNTGLNLKFASIINLKFLEIIHILSRQ